MPARAPTITGDPGSAQAARDRVALYYKLIAEKRFDAAQALWSSGPIRSESASLFAARFAGEEKVRAEVGIPFAPEGAAGSVNITVPVIVRGVPALAIDQPYELHRLVILRRLNAAPNSPGGERQWQIHEVRDIEAGPEGLPRPIAY